MKPSNRYSQIQIWLRFLKRAKPFRQFNNDWCDKARLYLPRTKYTKFRLRQSKKSVKKYLSKLNFEYLPPHFKKIQRDLYQLRRQRRV